MKFFLAGLFLITALSAQADEIRLEPGDQERLAYLLSELPTSVRERTMENILEPRPGLIVKSVFPKAESAFKITCLSKYYNGSQVASSGKCQLTVDTHHPDTDVHYDEFKVILKDLELTQALFDTIQTGSPEKEIRAFNRDTGISFEGKRTLIFDYYFKCSAVECQLKFSKRSSKAEPPQ